MVKLKLNIKSTIMQLIPDQMTTSFFFYFQIRHAIRAYIETISYQVPFPSINCLPVRFLYRYSFCWLKSLKSWWFVTMTILVCVCVFGNAMHLQLWFRVQFFFLSHLTFASDDRFTYFSRGFQWVVDLFFSFSLSCTCT